MADSIAMADDETTTIVLDDIRTYLQKKSPSGDFFVA